MEQVYTQRTASPILDLTTELPETARRRILIVLMDHVTEHAADDHWETLRIELLKRYGGLHASHYRAATRSDQPAIEHFFACPSDRAIDFVELFFRQAGYSGGQEGVDEVNQILREEGVAFAFSPYIEHESEGFFRGRKKKITRPEYPRAIPRSDHLLHQTLTEPALHALSDSRFVVANKEMLDAYGSLRRGDWENAITLSCSAFESVLRTICGLKGWPVDPSATCSALVSACQAHGLFPGLYAPAFNAVGTIRNKLSDAHGRGPQPSHIATEAEADLFRLLIHDLSTGRVIRQERDVNQLGQFVRKRPKRTLPGRGATTMESAFEDTKPYVLTELGKQFVHYTMNEVVARVEGPDEAAED